MTWVTIQTHDIGDTFLGIYALERVFGIGGADAICPRLQGKKGVLRFIVPSFWDQSQAWLQMAQTLSAGGRAGRWGCFAPASFLRKSGSHFLPGGFCSAAPHALPRGAQRNTGPAARS